MSKHGKWLPSLLSQGLMLTIKARLKKAFLDRGSGTLIKVSVYLVSFNCPSVLVLEVFGIYFGCTSAALRCM